MNQPLALEDIAGLSLTLIGTLIETYVAEGYADPTMYKALEASAKLAEQFRARLEYDGEDNPELLDGVTDLLDNLRVTAMECGEVVNRIIEDNNLPVQKNTFEPDTDHPRYNECDHNGEDGE
jgi:hypothetical protein